jgi:oxygen-dependent protoporphyrinogen oxidase
MPKVVIVGAGISGLALAYRLQQANSSLDITVLEQRDRPGGTVWTERRDGFQIEIGPNGFLDNKPSTITLCRDLGLGEQLVPASESAGLNRYLFFGEKLKLLPNGLGAFLRSDLLSWHGKFNFLSEWFRRPRRGPGDESIETFARRRAGNEVADVFADAFVTGIYAGDPALLSVRASFPRLAMLEEKYGSVMKGFACSLRERRAEAQAKGEPPPRAGKMWSLREGLRGLIEQLTRRLAPPPVCGAGVKRVEGASDPSQPAWIVRGHARDKWAADAVVLTCPAYQQAALLADLDSELADRVGDIAYNRVAVVALGYRRADVPHDLDGFGYIAPQRTRREVLGVQWCSSIFSDRAPQGFVLLRAMCGGWHRAEVAGWDDPRLLDAVRADLRQALGVTAAPVMHHVARWDRAIPQYQLGHLERVAWIEERAGRHPGLFLAGNAYRGVALNDCTEQGGILAGRIGKYLQGVL